jgi:16S rRNA (cytosine1402-N4)-methyltransferase
MTHEDWKTQEHTSVLKRELVAALNLQPGSTVIDCTAGLGGHTELMLEAVGDKGKVFAIDRDPWAVSRLRSRFEQQIHDRQLIVVEDAFSNIGHILKDHEIDAVDGIAADLGVSSPQLDVGERGFSFNLDGPLNMRMDSDSNKTTAASLVNELSKDELKEIFWIYGEEPKAKFIAEAIVDFRMGKPIETTRELANIIKKAVFYPKASKKHPATKAFQALRIYLNDELGELKSLLHDGFESLSQGGRLAIISFHSLEDRLIKHKFKELAGKTQNNPSMRHLPITDSELKKTYQIAGKIIKPFPIYPNESELKVNIRSRSAKLRVIEKTNRGTQ